MPLQMPADERLCYVREMRMTGEIAANVGDRDRSGGSCCALPLTRRPARPATGVLLTGSWCHTGNYGAAGGHARALCGLRATRRPAPESGGSFAFSSPPPPPGLGLCERVFRTRPAAHGALIGLRVARKGWRGGQRVHQLPQREAYGSWPRWGAGSAARRTEYQFITNNRTDDDGKYKS